MDPRKEEDSKKREVLEMIIKYLNDISNAKNNKNIVFENFINKNEEFKKFSDTFQANGWENILKNPYQNQAKFKRVIETYFQKMQEVKTLKYAYIIFFKYYL